MTTKKQFVSGISWNSLTVIFQIVIQLVYTGLLARMISESSFAMMGPVLGIMGFAEIFSQVGIGPSLIQRKEVHQEHINTAFYSSVFLGVFFTLLFMALAPWISAEYKIPELTPIIRVVCCSFVISSLAVVPRSMMIKGMHFRKFFVAGMISIVGGNLIVGLLLAYLGYDVWSYVWALFAQNVLMTLGFWIFQPVKLRGEWNWKSLQELIRYGGGSTLFNALNYAATKLDVILIPIFGQKISGIDQNEQLRRASMYERSSYVMQQPVTIMGKLSDNVLFSGMARLQDEREKLVRTMLIATNSIACLIVPATAFIHVFAPDIVRIYLGEKFLDAIPILQVLIIAVIFRTLTKLGDSLLRARDAVYLGSFYKFIYLVLIAAGIVLAIPYGMTAVAWAINIATFIHYIMSMYLCNKLIKVRFSSMFRALMPSIILGLVVLVLSYLSYYTTYRLETGALISLLSGILSVGLVMFALIYFFPSLLGPAKWSPLQLVPDRFMKFKIIRRIIDRM